MFSAAGKLQNVTRSRDLFRFCWLLLSTVFNSSASGHQHRHLKAKCFFDGCCDFLFGARRAGSFRGLNTTLPWRGLHQQTLSLAIRRYVHLTILCPLTLIPRRIEMVFIVNILSILFFLCLTKKERKSRATIASPPRFSWRLRSQLRTKTFWENRPNLAQATSRYPPASEEV